MIPTWLALPQPTVVDLDPSRWAPDSVRVLADHPDFTREAERLANDLAALGIPLGDASVIRIEDTALQGEAYEIDVAGDVSIRAGSAVGAFRASRQIVQNLRAQGWVPGGRVAGAPAVRERGLHLDAARKYFPAEWIIRQLRAAADVGINVFQWHFSENEGFRLESLAFPEIVSEHHITRSEAARILEVAADLHIAVVPSLDMPGHLRHVLAAHPDFCLPHAGDLPTAHALDITNGGAVRFAHALIADMARIFPDSAAWHLGGDEFVDFAQIDGYPALESAARQRYGDSANGFDVLTAFVNETALVLREHGYRARVWNDGMLRSRHVKLDSEIELTWWTNWHSDMSPLSQALHAGHQLTNFNDSLFYYVLGEMAGYRYPTAERVWEADWHPGRFPSLPSGAEQEISAPYPEALRGVSFSVWCDDPDAQTTEEVAADVRTPLRALAERAWNAGTSLSLDSFLALDAAIGTSFTAERV